MTNRIFKLTTQHEWDAAEQAGVFKGAPLDLADGFIHFSTASQTPETAKKYFHGQEGLLLVAIDAAALGQALKWEPSRGGELFPHLYAPLKTSAMLWKKPISLDASGAPIISL